MSTTSPENTLGTFTQDPPKHGDDSRRYLREQQHRTLTPYIET